MMMNNTIQLTREQLAQLQAGKAITIEPPEPEKLDRFKPKDGERFYRITGTGYVDTTEIGQNPTKLLEHYNAFKSLKQAEKASKLQRRSNAIIMACLTVDPDFVADWDDSNQVKYGPYYHHDDKSWDVGLWTFHNSAPAYVSTREKAEQACKLLTEWGVE